MLSARFHQPGFQDGRQPRPAGQASTTWGRPRPWGCWRTAPCLPGLTFVSATPNQGTYDLHRACGNWQPAGVCHATLTCRYSGFRRPPGIPCLCSNPGRPDTTTPTTTASVALAVQSTLSAIRGAGGNPELHGWRAQDRHSRTAAGSTSFTVSPGLERGRSRLSRAGYTFSPVSRTYTYVSADQRARKLYRLRDPGGQRRGGLAQPLSYNGWHAKKPLARMPAGTTRSCPYGWSGTVTTLQDRLYLHADHCTYPASPPASTLRDLFIFRHRPLSFLERQVLARMAQPVISFGNSVAISGDTAVVEHLAPMEQGRQPMCSCAAAASGCRPRADRLGRRGARQLWRIRGDLGRYCRGGSLWEITITMGAVLPFWQNSNGWANTAGGNS